MKTYTCLLLLTLNLTVFSQKSNNFINIEGITTKNSTYNESQRLENVTIHIYEYNTKLTTYYSDNKGKFEFTIPKNSYIVLVFEKENYIQKKILFDTRTSAKVDKIKPFDLEVVLLDYVAGINYNDLDFPITRVEYSEEIQDYNYAEKYTKAMMIKQEKIIGKLRDYQSKISSR